jgi:NAD(P)-dependent dehydrogenase (short-subunit alcohol dehydrogenase family)
VQHHGYSGPAEGDREAKQKLGPIRVLVNNAAHDQRHAIDTVTPEYWDERYAVNLKHQFFAAQAVYKDMAAAGGRDRQPGVDIVGGRAGGMPCYTSAKSAVAGLTRALARDFGRSTSASTASCPAGS